MNDETMKYGLLMEAAQAHQLLAESSLQRLKSHTDEIDGIVREEIRRTLIDELQSLSADTNGAIQSLRALRRAADMRIAVWSIGITSLCCVMVIAIVLGAAHWLLPARSEIAALRARHEQLEISVASLEAHGGGIDLRRCGAAQRFCVRIDRKAPVFGQAADFYVVAGY